MADPSSEVLPDEIREDDEFGREEQSSRYARKALRKRERGPVGHARMSAFKVSDELNELSVNRMGLAPDAEIAGIGMRNAAAAGRSFWGWYVLSAGNIRSVGCAVEASPLADNPHHADIIVPVPLDAEDRRDAIIEHAMDLADRAVFQPWGDWIDGAG